MLVQCEFHEVDGTVQADIICEHCNEVAWERATMNDVLNLVHGTRPALCNDCEASKCKTCGKLPTPKDQATYGAWVNGVCWACRDEFWEKLQTQVKALLSLSE